MLSSVTPSTSRPLRSTPGAFLSFSSARSSETSSRRQAHLHDLAHFLYRAVTLASTEEEKATYYTNRATCYAQLHHFKEVVDDTTAAINIKPSSKAYLRRGLALESLEKYKLALEDMKKVLELDPSAMVASQAIHRLTRAVNNL